jgi:hypothetical protein
MGSDKDWCLLAVNKAVSRWVYNQVVAIVDACAFKLMTKSPSYMSSPKELDEPSASIYVC